MIFILIYIECNKNSAKIQNYKTKRDNSINFHVTSERLKSVISLGSDGSYNTDEDILDFFDKLSKKVGADMNTLISCKSLYQYLLDVDGDVAELFLNIMDKDFKCGVNLKTILSVFPDVVYEFNVALANKYFGNEKKVNFDDGSWWASRKMDGCRCLAVVSFDGEKQTCVTWSRQGKRFETLSKLEREIEDFCTKNNIKDIVLDGECCIVDENGIADYQYISHCFFQYELPLKVSFLVHLKYHYAIFKSILHLLLPL